MANKNKVIRKTIECIEYLSVEAPLRKVDYLEDKQKFDITVGSFICSKKNDYGGSRKWMRKRGKLIIKDLSVIQKVLRCIQWERQNFRN